MRVGKIFFMTTQTSNTKTVFGKLIRPLISLVDKCNYKRKCNALPDLEWIKTGLLRMKSLIGLKGRALGRENEY